MKTLLSCVVDELLLRYPQATPQAISQALINSIENEILPMAVKTMKLPPPPSKMQLLLEKKRMERQKKKYRQSTKEKEKTVIEEFETLKYILNGYFNDYTTEEQLLALDGSFNDSGSRYTFLDTSFHREIIEKYDGISTSPKVGYSRAEKPTEQEKGNPYSKKLFRPEKRPPNFIISREVREKIWADLTIREVVSSIETQLREISTHFPKMAFSIYVKNDEEIPTWEKIIVNLKFPSLDIRKKLELWDKVDAQIRKRILDSTRAIDGSNETELQNINRKLFIHLDL